MAISWLINGVDPNHLNDTWDDPPTIHLRPAAKRMIRLAEPKLRPAQILTQDSQKVGGEMVGRVGGEKVDPESTSDHFTN